MSSSSSPCAACKFLRRKCTQGCVFAPYFPPDQPQKFGNVHRVFGASNVAKLLNELSPAQREDAVNSLAYEANMRLSDPVYGCVGYIFILQHKLRQIQHDLDLAKKELATYVAPAFPYGNQFGYNNYPQLGLGPTVVAAPQQQMIMQAQQQSQQQQQMVAAAAREQEMMRSLEQDLFRYGGGNEEANAAAGLALVSPQQSYESNAFHQVGTGGAVVVGSTQQQQQTLQIEYLDQQHVQQAAGSDERRSHGGGGGAGGTASS